MDTKPLSRVGIAWYTRDDYPAILELMVDADLLPKTFDQWLQRAEKLEERIREQGATPVRAHLDPDAFRVGCSATGKNVDAHGRMAYASFIAASGDERIG